MLWVRLWDRQTRNYCLPGVLRGLNSGNLQLDEFPVLQPGDSITLHGYTITVTADNGHTHTVTITQDKLADARL